MIQHACMDECEAICIQAHQSTDLHAMAIHRIKKTQHAPCYTPADRGRLPPQADVQHPVLQISIFGYLQHLSTQTLQLPVPLASVACLVATETPAGSSHSARDQQSLLLSLLRVERDILLLTSAHLCTSRFLFLYRALAPLVPQWSWRTRALIQEMVLPAFDEPESHNEHVESLHVLELARKQMQALHGTILAQG